MKCYFCNKRNAIIHIQEHSKSGVRDIYVCLECAAIKGFNIEAEQVHDFFYSFLNNIVHHISSHRSRKSRNQYHKKIKCPDCGMTIEMVSEKKQLGCQNCFSYYQDVVDFVIYNINNSIEYRGRLPDTLASVRDFRLKIFDLKRKLSQYVATEDFFNAIRIREQIKATKKEYNKIRNGGK